MSYRNIARSSLAAALVCLILSVLATAAVLTVDVQPIGQMGTAVGLASINGAVWSALGASDLFDKVSDILLVVSLLAVLAFGIIGVKQLVIRKSLAKVDRTLWLLLALYAVMLLAYVACDMVAVNYAPMLDQGQLKPSFPSSHVLCVVAVAVSSAFAIRQLSPSETACKVVTVVAILLVIAIVLTRMASGAHWFSDIMCGALYGLTLAFAFGWICNAFPARQGRHSR